MGSQKAILLIEDDSNFARVLETQLRRTGFDIFVAREVTAGLQQLLHRPFDLVLVDIRLPDANGLEVLPRLRAITPSTPFLLITAYEEENLRAHALAAGAADVLYKPFDMDMLVEAVRAHISETGLDARGEEPLPWLAVTTGQVVVLQSGERREPVEQTARVERTHSDTFEVGASNILSFDMNHPVTVNINGRDALYQFQTRVMEVKAAGTALVLTQPKTIRRKQRRLHPRVGLNLPVCLTEPESHAAEIEGMIRDVSLGGLALVTPHYVAPETRVTLQWSLPSPFDGDVRVHATVLRAEAIHDMPQFAIYRLSIRFGRFLSGTRSLLKDYLKSLE